MREICLSYLNERKEDKQASTLFWKNKKRMEKEDNENGGRTMYGEKKGTFFW